jgi:hypothetical protein
MQLTEGAQNCPFLILIIFPVLAAATRRSVCYGGNMFAPGMQNVIILISVSKSRFKYMNKIKGPFQLYLMTERG